MSGPAPFPYTVRIELRPYNHSTLRELLTKATKEFGPPHTSKVDPSVHRRWCMITTTGNESNDFVVDLQWMLISVKILFSQKLAVYHE